MIYYYLTYSKYVGNVVYNVNKFYRLCARGVLKLREKLILKYVGR